MKRDPFPGYQDLEDYLRSLPMTWYPALIGAMVEAAYSKGVFRPGKAGEFIDTFIAGKARLKDLVPAKKKP